MSLVNVWVQTQSDGLVRADQVTGIDAHQSPALSGKPSRWLLDVVLAVPIGGGARDAWTITALHRTLLQTSHDPGDAPATLARLFAQLDLVNAAGVIVAINEPGAGPAPADPPAPARTNGAGSTGVRFQFVPFPSPPPGHHTGAEYL